MAKITIKVNTVDRTDSISPLSFNLNRGLTNQVDTCTFTVERTQASDWKPDMLNVVEIKDAEDTVIFGGTIVTINETFSGGVESVQCQCKDGSFEMDRRLVVATFEGETVADIISYLATNFMTGFTTTNVVCDKVIDFIAFNYEYPSKVIQQLAELVKYDWYVDSENDIHFFAKSSTLAPFELSDDNENYYIDSLVVKKDATKLKNVAIVRGGEYLGGSYTETYIADGSQLIVNIGQRYNGITITVNGVSKTVGIDNIDSADDFDCLYNFQEKFIRFKTSTKPSTGHAVVVSGTPYLPVVSRNSSPSSIATYGVFEYKIVDNTIGSKESARERGRAELNDYDDLLNEGSFTTSRNGLEVGQNIRIQSTKRGIDETFIITRITTTIRADDLLHRCTITTTRTFGMVEFLQELLIRKDKEIKVSANEILDILFEFSDEFSFEDEVTDVSTQSPPYYWSGTHAPVLLDSYSETNQSTNIIFRDVLSRHAQSFIGNGNNLYKATFYLKKGATVDGTIYAELYASSGNLPTGSALATSNSINANDLTSSYQLIDFIFPEGQKYNLVNGTKYFIAIRYTGTYNGTTLNVGADSTSPTHSGDSANFSTFWATSSNDRVFYLYTEEYEDNGALWNFSTFS